MPPAGWWIPPAPIPLLHSHRSSWPLSEDVGRTAGDRRLAALVLVARQRITRIMHAIMMIALKNRAILKVFVKDASAGGGRLPGGCRQARKLPSSNIPRRGKLERA
jgi:hypothetical protein